MIRFRCTNCDRDYVLPDALAGLPLLCKGCGQRLNVPEGTPDPEPQPFPETEIASPASALPGKVPPVATEPEFRVDLPPEPTTVPLPPKKREPVAESAPVTPARRGRVLGLAADIAVGVVLAGGGALLGEFATGRGTGTILRDAGSAPKFPPIDLLLWLGCVATPVLAYVLFANRGKSVGRWLGNRA